MAKFTGTNGNDNLLGAGTADLMIGLLGDDTLDGAGQRDTLDGGGGNDKLIGGSSSDSLIGGDGLDTLDGGTGNDTLLGGKDNDSLIGGDGGDSLDGGLGNDTMNGGNGGDLYIVDSGLDSVSDSGAELSDTIQATISINLAGYAGIEHVILSGSGNIDAIGSAANNHLTGNSGANKLQGGAGGDTLEGGGGGDILTGDSGNDTYVIDALDVAKDAGGDADDRVRGAFAIDLNSLALTGIEHATLTGMAALKITGNGGDNMLIGNGGANTLTGGAGTDTMIGGDGNDLYNAETGDVVIEYAGGGTDQVTASDKFSLAGTAVENLLLTDTVATTGVGNELANKITGDKGADSFTGQDGNDTLTGNGGKDFLDGGAGDDSLIGGDGSDFYVVDNLGDKVVETGTKDSAADQVTSAVDYVLGANLENLSFTNGADHAGTGNALANTISGNVGSDVLSGLGGNDTLDGILGDDLLMGGDGDDFLRAAENVDTLIGGAGTDTFDFQFADVNRDTIADFNSDFGGDILDFSSLLAGYTGGSNPADFIQTVVVGGSTQINIDVNGPTGGIAYTLTAATLQGVSTDLNGLIANGVILLPGGAPASTTPTLGTAAANTLNGDGFSNFIDGAAANDTLTGGAGNDTLIGGAGIDKMEGGAGDDTFGIDNAKDIVTDSGGTNDRIRASISIDLSKYTGIEHATLTGKAALNLTGDGGANLLVGNDGANILKGAAADDSLDTLIGGAGNDKYYIDGGVNDVVIEYAGGGVDEIVQLGGTYAMTAYVENLTTAAGTFATKSTGNELANKLTGNDGNNTLEGGDGNDLLTGNKGGDSLVGGTGADTMVGGLGSDVYYVDDAGDKIVETGSDSDAVASAISYTLGAGVEFLLLLTGAPINGTGNSAANIIAGNNDENQILGLAADDTLNGGNGDDTLLGGDGNDTLNGQFDVDLLIGGAGKDRFVIDATYLAPDIIGDLEVSYLGGDVIDLSALVVGATSGTLSDYVRVTAANGSTLIEVDKDGAGAGFAFQDAVMLTGVVTDGSGLIRGGIADFGIATGGTDIEIGTAGKDTLNAAFSGIAFGAGGNDSLTGNGGAETLDGGAGADTMRGSNGDDTYVIDSALDVIIEEGLDDNDMVRGSISIDLRDDTRFINIEHAVLTGAAALKLNGDEQDNFLGGNAGANVIDGGTGSDTMAGGAGNDSFYVNGSDDTVIEYVGGGTDTVFSVGDFTLGDQVENLTLQGFLAYDGIGNDLANKITGNTADNQLGGMGGNDTLTGGVGADKLDGGTGADSLVGGSGNDLYVVDDAGDRIVEGAGDSSDMVFSFIGYTLGTNLEALFLQGTGNIAGTGNGGNNTVVGNAGDNILSGLAGNDAIRGGDGNDLLLGGDGIDALGFSAGQDTLIGGLGPDRFGTSATGVGPLDPADIIVDFETGFGADVLDFSAFFDETTSPDVLANPSLYIQTVTADGNTTVRVDLDGAGAGAAFDVCVLQGVSTDLNGLLSQGNIIPATDTILAI